MRIFNGHCERIVMIIRPCSTQIAGKQRILMVELFGTRYPFFRLKLLRFTCIPEIRCPVKGQMIRATLTLSVQRKNKIITFRSLDLPKTHFTHFCLYLTMYLSKLCTWDSTRMGSPTIVILTLLIFSTLNLVSGLAIIPARPASRIALPAPLPHLM